MTIRDVSNKGATPANPAPAQPAAPGGLPAPLEKSLVERGLVSEGRTPREAAEHVAAQLRERGFSPPQSLKNADFAQQFLALIRQFQTANRLAITGKIDEKTAAAMMQVGMQALPAVEQPATKKARDNFERLGTTPSMLGHGAAKRAELVTQSSPDSHFLDALLDKLGTGAAHGGTSAADMAGATGSQNAAIAPASASPGNQQEQVKQRQPNESPRVADTGHAPLERGNAQGVKVSRGLRGETSGLTARREPLPASNVAGDGDGQADIDDAPERRRQGDHGGNGDSDGSGDGSTGATTDTGDNDGIGSASSGDEHSGVQGHASIDDGNGETPGHYRVPSLSEQAFAALLAIQKDPAVTNRATTYSWDVMFLRPGVYGAGQKAEELVHLVVDHAAAFDAVWQKAQLNLQALVQRAEPHGLMPSIEEILGALRVARSRTADAEAERQPLKVSKPIGRA